MSQIRIERVPIKGLGVAGFDHLQLVFEPDVANPRWPQDDWFVLEGVFDNGPSGPTLGVIGTDGQTTLPAANGGLSRDELVAEIGTPSSRGSRVVPVAGDAFSAWQTMAAYAADIDAQQLPYNAQLLPSRVSANLNSSSVVATLLYVIGIDAAQTLPFGVGRTSGWTTLIGSSGDDDLKTEFSFTTLVGGAGDDTFEGRNDNTKIEKFYGGLGDDDFGWSEGSNVYHGGQLRLDYVRDGIDTIDYSNIGTVTIDINPDAIPHLSPDLIAIHATGTDYLLSVERVRWATESDNLILGPGLDVLRDRIFLEFNDQAGTGQGDLFDFSGVTQNTLIIAGEDPDLVFVQSEDNIGTDIGVWLQSVEWIVASSGDDAAYTGPSVRGIDGGGGDDLIDGRLATAFSASSPEGYDLEIYGGAGDDTIVSGTGLTFANGGEGNDRFIIAALSDPGQTVEFVIEDADAGDRLFAPYNFFNPAGGEFEGSELLPLLGGLAQFPGEAGFENLPQNVGPFTPDTFPREDYFPFAWQLENEKFLADDQTQGAITFTGNIFYNRDGDDLLIHLFLGEPDPEILIGGFETPYTFVFNNFFPDTETIIRIVDFQEGDLGIIFPDLGDPSPVVVEDTHGVYSFTSYSNWDNAVLQLTNNGQLEAPLDPRPIAPVYDPDDDAPPAPPNIVAGTSEDDLISALEGDNEITAGAGDDVILTGDGDDRIDGGDGTDDMTGGGGDDTYIVDNAADSVTEQPGGGNDTVVASVSFTLPGNVENLTLFDATGSFSTSSAAPGAGVSAATSNMMTVHDGTGNELRNRLIGNGADNTLTGLGGDDTLYGAGGNDHLVGGTGSDGYVYFAGDGDDIISDFGSPADVDRLVLDAMEPEDVTFHRLSAAPDDPVLTFAQGGRVQITDFLKGTDNNGIDVIKFLGVAEWSRAELEAIAAAAPLLDNEPPQAVDDPLVALRGPNAILPADYLLRNDRDFDGDPISIVAVETDRPDVTATLKANGDVELAAAPGFDGELVVTYTISDALGNQSTARADIVIYPNQAPELNGVIADQTSPEDSAWSFTLPPDVFVDRDGDALNLFATLADGEDLPAWISFDPATATFSGTPPADFHGSYQIRVTASDGAAAASTDFGLTITPVNDPPIARPDGGFQVTQGSSLVITSGDLLANDSDADGDTLTLVSVGDAVHGTVALDGAGNVTFVPEPGHTGPASFTYSISDGAAETASTSVTISVVEDTSSGTIFGTPGPDRLTGTPSGDRFDGLGGDDRLYGLAGDDIFLGGAGSDRMWGGSGSDTVDYSQSPAAVHLNFLFEGKGRGGDAEGDRLFSIERVIGSDFADAVRGGLAPLSIFGGAGPDRLTGGFSSDRLDGGTGTDRLAGSFGADVFVFAEGYGGDTITDFSGSAQHSFWAFGHDVIELDIDGVQTLQDVLDHASQQGSNLVLDFGEGDVLTLQGVSRAQLDADDFRFI